MRLRFTIRDLLWLTALAAVLVAWWLNNRSLRRQFLVESNRARVQEYYRTHGYPHAEVVTKSNGD
jgi:hypothetical protein